MLCPICKNTALEDRELELGLKGHSCTQCGGNWVRYTDYDEWKNSEGSAALSNEEPGCSPEYDNKKANFCPDCGRILIKYRVAGSLPFYVDHCNTCHGLWLDRHEWECIVDNDLQKKMNDFFTQSWQNKIRRDMSRQRFEEAYRKKFGEENYGKLKETREWMYKSGLKGEMIAYLIDEDPYKL